MAFILNLSNYSAQNYLILIGLGEKNTCFLSAERAALGWLLHSGILSRNFKYSARAIACMSLWSLTSVSRYLMKKKIKT